MLDVLDLSHHQGAGPVGQRRAVVDLAAAKAAGAVAVIIRATYGMRLDELGTEHARRADAAGLPRMLYWYPLSRQGAAGQARLAHAQIGRVGVRAWQDMEESAHNDGHDPQWPRYSDAYFRFVDDGLRAMDDLTGVLTGVYSSKTYLDGWFTEAQQARWAERFGWWAHYTSLPSPRIPEAWEDKPRPYELWQYAIGRWPGFAGAVDLNRTAAGVTVADLMGTPPAPAPAPVSATAQALMAHTDAIAAQVAALRAKLASHA